MSVEQWKYYDTTPKGSVLILGGNSDIAKELETRFNDEDYEVHKWVRGETLWQVQWDVCINALGVLNPIGNFFDTPADAWEENIESNVLLPLRLLRGVWKNRRKHATVIFFSGAGVSKPAQTYSAYSASKIMLFKMAELLDDEEPDTKFVILGPGMVRTKIQNQTLEAAHQAMNYERVRKFMTDGDPLHKEGTSHDKIYECVRWCMSAPKSAVGGRNIYIPLDKWGGALEEYLKADPNRFKLRRMGDGEFS